MNNNIHKTKEKTCKAAVNSSGLALSKFVFTTCFKLFCCNKLHLYPLTHNASQPFNTESIATLYPSINRESIATLYPSINTESIAFLGMLSPKEGCSHPRKAALTQRRLYM